MEKENARNQALEQLHERRKQVVRLHKKGIKIMQIVAMTGLSYPPVRSAIDFFEAGGWSAIKPARSEAQRGRRADRESSSAVALHPVGTSYTTEEPVHLKGAEEAIDPLQRNPFFTVEGVVLEVLGGYGVAHVRAKNGSVYGLNRQTAGVEFANLHKGQPLRLEIADKFGRVLRAEVLD